MVPILKKNEKKAMKVDLDLRYQNLGNKHKVGKSKTCLASSVCKLTCSSVIALISLFLETQINLHTITSLSNPFNQFTSRNKASVLEIKPAHGTSRYINEAAALKICSELVTSDHQWAVLLNAGLWDHIVLSPIALTLQYGLLLVNMVISSVFMIGIYTTVCRSLSSKPSRKPVIPHNSLH
ncbi:transmembrane protein, putative [Medicago truncatula]|uniref:Transmembrane protein, putative n=1 Tax=Medicago truncatula TaxID=3880 RepID=G7J564_MEDTR|nr:transmembrane protein, putative [Medicago truncatula]